jgi:hypothetical protein
LCSCVQRIQTLLEEANVKLCSVIRDIMAASGRLSVEIRAAA